MREEAERIYFADRVTGIQYKRLAHQVLGDVDDVRAARDVDLFVVDDAGEVHFARARGRAQTPTSLVVHGPIIGMEFKHGTPPPETIW